MFFDTFQYWIFFAAVVLALGAMRPTPAKWLLVVASYVFYAFWDWRFIFLLGASTLANWLFGLWIDRGEGSRRKRALTAAIVFNLVTLGFFKYFNFFADSFAALLHLDPHTLTLRIVLPVGISFHVRRHCLRGRRLSPRSGGAPRCVDFALFISFFPLLIAGPIIRPVNFFPQTGSALSLDSSDARWGCARSSRACSRRWRCRTSSRRSRMPTSITCRLRDSTCRP
jgi:D-alanyl-lipoteichoic acid acyltransferase DltB (MBOAT superfamily)